MTRRSLLLVSALLASAPVLAAPAADPLAQRLSMHDRILGSDAYEGRGIATRAEPKTIAYLVSQFQAAGLAPGGDLVNGKRQWTQAVPLLRSEFAADPTVSLTLADGKTLPLVQREQIALLSPLDGSKHVDIAKAPLVFVGYGVTAPERGWDDFKGVDVRGKIIVVLINDPGLRGRRRRLRRQGDDLLRPLDLQVRGSRAARRGRDHDRPRDRSGRLRLGDGQEQQHRRRISTSSAPTRANSTARSKAGSSATWQSRSLPPPASTSSRRGLPHAARISARSRSRRRSTRAARPIRR